MSALVPDEMTEEQLIAAIAAAEAEIADARQRLVQQTDDIPEETLALMVRAEAERRVSPEIQEAYARVEAAEEDDSWMEVTEVLQQDVCRSFGFGLGGGVPLGTAVAQLRGAAPRYPEVAFWVKHNRARRGNLLRGQPVPDFPLALVEVNEEAPSTRVGLHDLVPADGRPLGIIALSYS